MRVKKQQTQDGCEVVEADFAWWPLLCGRMTPYKTEQDGVSFWICAEHIAEARKAAASTSA